LSEIAESQQIHGYAIEQYIQGYKKISIKRLFVFIWVLGFLYLENKRSYFPTHTLK